MPVVCRLPATAFVRLWRPAGLSVTLPGGTLLAPCFNKAVSSGR